MDLREVGYDDRDWINLAQDRDRWWAYYCQWLMEDVTTAEEELNDKYWMDEAWFLLNGYVNTQNMHIWLAENLVILQKVPLYSQKIGMWITESRNYYDYDDDDHDNDDNSGGGDNDDDF
ncbi:hypothetical protein ANN_25141 [Periplaneta americana]|uniref:Uncharacterized protein n=1 Tax=Periplaneta americana TaxID=6978 RepID=A0ABQ8S0J1_PERAM|nr:hypothetical protein ANN_25141 [Periplaneta americana]